MPQDFSQNQLDRGFAEVDSLDAQAADALRDAGALTTDTVGPEALCDVWRRIRPIVEGVSDLFFIPPNVRRALKLLIGVVDGICPQ